MDTSEQYIKMCDCPKIQSEWKPEVGDWFLHDWHGTTKMGRELEDKVWPEKEKWERIECLTYKPSIDDYIEVSEADGNHGIYTSSELLKDRHIWLPRQDQLQEMMKGSPYQKFCRIRTFIRYIDWGNEKDTFEKLWLAFVMKEKFNKIWSGTEWNLVSEVLNARV